MGVDEWSFLLPFRRFPIVRGMSDEAAMEAGSRVSRVVVGLCRAQRVPRLGAVVLGLSFYPGCSVGPVLGELDSLLDVCVAGLVLGRVLPDSDVGRVVSRGVEVVPRVRDPYDASTPRFVLRVRDASVLAPIGVS